MLEGLQNQKQNDGKNSAQRGPRGNKLKPGPGIWLFERVYCNSPRWDNPDEVQPHVKKLFKGKQKDMNRESDVVAKMHTAWDTHEAKRSPALNFEEGRHMVAVCVTPMCDKRTQVVGQPQVVAVKRSHAKAGWSHPVCSNCANPLSIQMMREIRGKWVYVLTGDGPEAKIRYEIFVDNEGQWHWMSNPTIGPRAHRDPSKAGKKQTGTGRIPAKFKPHELVQFFLSPVQLTENAMKRLLSVARQTDANRREEEQLEVGTVRRCFQNLGLGNKEIVTVLDPFSYAEEATYWDYEQVCDAWFSFNLNENENTKRHISVLLNAIVGKEDEHDMVDEMDDDGGRWGESAKVRHKSEAWLKRYQDCRKFLMKAQNDAAARVINWMDGDAHAIVEIACQQEPDQPGFQYPGKSTLSLAMLHFASVLEHMLACPSGAAYVTRLATRPKRLIHRFLLNPNEEDKQQLKLVREELGSIAVNLFAVFLPKIIKDAPLYQEADRVAKHLRDHELEVATGDQLQKRTPFGHTELLAIADNTMGLNDALIKAYKRGFLPESLAETAPWKLRTKMADLVQAYELFTGFKTFTEDGDYEGVWDGLKHYKKKVDHVHNVANFMVAQSKLSFAWYVKRTANFDITALEDTLVKSNWKAIIESGQFARYEKLIGYYRTLHRVERVLGGPVAFVLGGFEYIANPPDVLAAWERNRGEAIGTALTYYGTGLAAAAALLQTIGMLSSFAPGAAAAAAAMVNPLLVVALVVTIVGAVIFWASRKNELEKYAAHCLFGDEYGEGDHEPRPWATKPYKYWDDTKGRYADQLRYLLNLIGNFKVQLISSQNGYVYVDGAKGARHTVGQLLYGGYVLPSYVPTGAKADCFVEGYYRTDDGRKPLKTRVLVDLSSGHHVAYDQNYRRINVEAIPPNSWGTERFRGLAVQVDHDLPAGYTKKDGYHHYKFGARLDLTGTKRYLPAGKDNYVEVENMKWKSDRSSLDVQPKAYYEKKKKKNPTGTKSSSSKSKPAKRTATSK